MLVNPADGVCRACGGTLEIIAADDASMTVECDCGELYLVEPDAFRDGALKYFVGYHAQAMVRASEEGGDEP